MSKQPTYENIASVLSGFVAHCNIMAQGHNTEHSLSDMVKTMVAAAACKSSVGGYAAAVRRAKNEDATAPSDEWVRKAFARSNSGTT